MVDYTWIGFGFKIFVLGSIKGELFMRGYMSSKTKVWDLRWCPISPEKLVTLIIKYTNQGSVKKKKKKERMNTNWVFYCQKLKEF